MQPWNGYRLHCHQQLMSDQMRITKNPPYLQRTTIFISPCLPICTSSLPDWDTYQEVKESIPSYQLGEEPKQQLKRGTTNRQVFTHLHAK